MFTESQLQQLKARLDERRERAKRVVATSLMSFERGLDPSGELDRLCSLMESHGLDATDLPLPAKQVKAAKVKAHLTPSIQWQPAGGKRTATIITVRENLPIDLDAYDFEPIKGAQSVDDLAALIEVARSYRLGTPAGAPAGIELLTTVGGLKSSEATPAGLAGRGVVDWLKSTVKPRPGTAESAARGFQLWQLQLALCEADVMRQNG